MLQLLMDDLMHQRALLCEALASAVTVTDRSDYVDCWNLLDEIGEHDRRIETLRNVLAATVAPRAMRN